MFAITNIYDKQYKISINDLVKIDKSMGNIGDKIYLERILTIGTKKNTIFGLPTIKGLKITALITEKKESKKKSIFYKRRRKNSKRQLLYKNTYTILKIINFS